MPKDNGYLIASIGHRHDWEYVMVFVKNYNDTYDSSKEKIVGTAYSAHGGISSTTSPNKSDPHVYANYDFHGSVTHSFEEGSKGSYEGIWGQLSSDARNSLNVRYFGNAVVPLKTARFTSKIAGAQSALGL